MNTADPLPAKAQPLPRKSLIARGCERWRVLTPGQHRRLRGLFIFAAALTLAFIKPLVSLMVYASGTELHSHIILIPLVSAYLLHINHRELPGAWQTSAGWGVALTAAGLAFLGCVFFWEPAVGPLSVNDRHVFPVLAFVSLLAAGGFFFLGRK